MNPGQIFIKRLIAARESKGFSLQRLADLTLISKQSISKFERGELKPSSGTIARLAQALGKSLDYFLSEDYPDQILEFININHREKDKVINYEFQSVKHDTLDYIQRYMVLEKLANNKQEFKNPITELVIKDYSDISRAVKLLRKKWNVGDQPINNVLELLEYKGIKVHEVYVSDNLEGFAGWVEKVPVIGINLNIKEKTRIRFTALHELGHLILNFDEKIKNNTEIVERLCNEFSGELLLPKEAIFLELGQDRTQITIEELKNIKEKYGISISAILITAVSNGAITRNIFKKWNASYQDWVDKREYFGEYKGTEKPIRFKKLLFNSLSENKISIGKAAALMNLSEGAFKSQVHYLMKEQHY